MANLILPDVCALLGYYAAYFGNPLLKFQEQFPKRHHQHTLRNIPEERRTHVLRGGSLKSRVILPLCFVVYFTSLYLFQNM
jgi:hypothetical protein